VIIEGPRRRGVRTTRQKFLIALLGAILLGFGATIALLVLPMWYSIPLSSTGIQDRGLPPSSIIVDGQGQLLYEMVSSGVGPQGADTGMHRPVPLEEIPLYLQQAIIATEDASFYENPGVSPEAILRALYINLRSGRIVSGGSTITQQLARNLLLEADERHQRTWQRKLREAILAYRMSRTLSKDDVLALYLNKTYFGNMAYGVEAAARSYFGKPIEQLNLAECALLAGLPQAPGFYNPHLNLPAAKERQRIVLDLMVRAGYISAQDADLAHREPLRLASQPFPINAPHMVMTVRAQLDQILPAETIAAGGLRVVTTLDLGLQRAAEDHVVRHLEQLNEVRPNKPSHDVRNAAVVVMDPRTAAVRAMVGSPDYFDARINGAVNAAVALRQPGSAIKPLTYAAAFERGYSPGTMILDVPTAFLTQDGKPYQPINYDYRFHGPVLLREALACSYNVATVKLLEQIGPATLAEMAHRLGITTLIDSDRHDLAMTLGGGEVSLMQLTGAYGALANGGYRVQPWFIERVEDREGRILYAHAAAQVPLTHNASPSSERVLDARVAYLITDILADRRARVPAFGAGSPLELPFPAAVKTGTTTGWRDNWTVGYTSEWVVGVWVGNADNQPMKQVSGVSGAAPIWNAVMRSAHRRTSGSALNTLMARPPGLVAVEVCALSGLLPAVDTRHGAEACTHLKTELFLAEAAPTQHCDLHRVVRVDALTGEICTDCPADRTVARSITLWPSEALGWAASAGHTIHLPGTPSASSATETNAPSAHLAHAAPIAPGEGPALRFVQPAPNSRFVIVPGIPAEMQKIEIAATATVRLHELTVWINGQPWHTWDAPPYTVLWPLSPGEHTLHLQGLDADTIAAKVPGSSEAARHLKHADTILSSPPIHVVVLQVGEERKAP
jgi:1A family penicillin-binding protein